MEKLRFICTLFLFVGTAYMLFQLTRTAKYLAHKGYNHDSTDVTVLMIILFIAIFVAPFLLTLPVFEPYNDMGQIGDTFGGLTAPFINGLGVVLIYITFKAQGKMNRQLRDLEGSRTVRDGLEWLKNDVYDLVKVRDQLLLDLAVGKIDHKEFNQVTYLLLEFENLYDISLKNEHEADMLIKQIQMLYRVYFRESFMDIQKTCILYKGFGRPHSILVADYMFCYQATEKKLKV